MANVWENADPAWKKVWAEMEDRPLTSCPQCGGEIDLTFASEGGLATCVICGSAWRVLGLDPPELAEEDDDQKTN